MDIIFKEYIPGPQLSPFVEFFWSGKFNVNAVSFFSQRVVPNGYIELIIHLSDFHCELLQGSSFSPSPNYTLIGMFSKPYDVHFRATVDVFGIRFKPEGIQHIFGVPAAEINAGFEDMNSVTGKHFREYTEQLKDIEHFRMQLQLSENYLLKNLNRNKINLSYLNHAAEIIRRRKGMISIEQLSAEVYISRRQLEREFKQKLGLSPKQYMRIARLNEVNRQIQNGRRILLTNLAYACGYSDQAHFIKDFKHFTGASPAVFVKERDRFIINPNAADLAES
ncbi:MAG: helix-turn-helix transcriptional regulator [Calditrichaeota bacterium]|nr:helix-turn-helix transcriptional regulator [Calditrichota bacterium]